MIGKPYGSKASLGKETSHLRMLRQGGRLRGKVVGYGKNARLTTR